MGLFHYLLGLVDSTSLEFSNKIGNSQRVPIYKIMSSNDFYTWVAVHLNVNHKTKKSVFDLC